MWERQGSPSLAWPLMELCRHSSNSSVLGGGRTDVSHFLLISSHKSPKRVQGHFVRMGTRGLHVLGSWFSKDSSHHHLPVIQGWLYWMHSLSLAYIESSTQGEKHEMSHRLLRKEWPWGWVNEFLRGGKRPRGGNRFGTCEPEVWAPLRERQRNAVPRLNTELRQFEAGDQCWQMGHKEWLRLRSSRSQELPMEAGWRTGSPLVSSDNGLSTQMLIPALSLSSRVALGESCSHTALFSPLTEGVIPIILPISVSQNCWESQLGQHMWDTLGGFHSAIETLIIKCDFTTAGTRRFLEHICNCLLKATGGTGEFH